MMQCSCDMGCCSACLSVCAMWCCSACRWLQRFERKFRLDPDFLTRQDEKY